MAMHERYEVQYELLKKKGWKLPGKVEWDYGLKTGLTLRLQWLDGCRHYCLGWKMLALGFRGVGFWVRRGSSGLRSGLVLTLDPKLWPGFALMFGL